MIKGIFFLLVKKLEYFAIINKILLVI